MCDTTSQHRRQGNFRYNMRTRNKYGLEGSQNDSLFNTYPAKWMGHTISIPNIFPLTNVFFLSHVSKIYVMPPSKIKS